MQINSLVEAMHSFDRIRSEWGYNYPYKGDILTVSDIQEHPNTDCKKRGIVLLFFKDGLNKVMVWYFVTFGEVILLFQQKLNG